MKKRTNIVIHIISGLLGMVLGVLFNNILITLILCLFGSLILDFCLPNDD